MRIPQEMDHLREQVVALRRQGKSRRQIKEILGPMSNSTLDDALQGERPPEWTRRPNAKDDLRAKAGDLRGQGMDLEEIAAALGVSKSSVSLWVRDLPVRPGSATPSAGNVRPTAQTVTGPPSGRFARQDERLSAKPLPPGSAS